MFLWLRNNVSVSNSYSIELEIQLEIRDRELLRFVLVRAYMIKFGLRCFPVHYVSHSSLNRFICLYLPASGVFSPNKWRRGSAREVRLGFHYDFNRDYWRFPLRRRFRRKVGPFLRGFFRIIVMITRPRHYGTTVRLLRVVFFFYSKNKFIFSSPSRVAL